MENLHKDHRKRLRDRYLSQDAEKLPEHNLLELMLFYAIPRKDTNEIAHELLVRFGSLRGVLDANMEALSTVKGIGESAATLIKLFGDIARVYPASGENSVILRTEDEIGKWLIEKYRGIGVETVTLLCFDKSSKLLLYTVIHEGDISSASFRIRKVTEAAIRTHAVYTVLAHNHPGRSTIPSSSDIDTTRRIADSLASNGIELREHYIISGDKYMPVMSAMGKESENYHDKLRFI